MPLLDPVSPFLALVDRLISLIKARETRRHDYFEKIIDPLYTQFTPLGEDYLRLFQAAREALEAPKRKHKSKLAEIRAKREEFAAARSKLGALLEVCVKHSRKPKDEDLIAFVRAMQKFFRPIVLRGTSSLGLVLVELFEEWARMDRSRYCSEETLTRFVIGSSRNLESAWYEIAGRYMELKLKYLD